MSDSSAPFLEGPGFGCFFIIGAMKAGTGSLYNYLAGHPDIYASPTKEPKFFAKPSPSGSEIRKYRALFEGRRAEFAARASAAMDVKEALAVIRRPEWRWHGE